MSETSPPTQIPLVEPVKITPPTIIPPTPTNVHLRVLIHGEVDEVVPSNTDEEQLARLIANDIKANNPTFKITKILIAHGSGPVANPL